MLMWCFSVGVWISYKENKKKKKRKFSFKDNVTLIKTKLSCNIIINILY